MSGMKKSATSSGTSARARGTDEMRLDGLGDLTDALEHLRDIVESARDGQPLTVGKLQTLLSMYPEDTLILVRGKGPGRLSPTTRTPTMKTVRGTATGKPRKAVIIV